MADSGILTERWSPSEAVAVAVKQRVIPGVTGIITTDLTSGLPHQWRRIGWATSDATTIALLKANEGVSSAVQVMDTIRYGKISAWLVKCRLPNPENRYDPLDTNTQVMEYEQIWQEAPTVIPPSA